MGDTGPDRPEDHRRHLRRRRPVTAAARSPARIRRRSTAPPRTRPATSQRTSSPRASPTCEVQRRLRNRRRAPGSHRGASRSRPSTYPVDRIEALVSRALRPAARRRPLATSTCDGRSSGRRPRTATSAATTAISPGSAPIKRTRCARPLRQARLPSRLHRGTPLRGARRQAAALVDRSAICAVRPVALRVRPHHFGRRVDRFGLRGGPEISQRGRSGDQAKPISGSGRTDAGRDAGAPLPALPQASPLDEPIRARGLAACVPRDERRTHFVRPSQVARIVRLRPSR